MGVKQIETRSWSTAYSGPLLTHPTKGKEEEKFLPMSRHLKNTYLILNYCLSVTSTDVIRIGPGALFNTSDEVMNKLTMEEKAAEKELAQTNAIVAP